MATDNSRVISAVSEYLTLYGTELTAAIKANITSAGKVATGDLLASINFKIVTQNGVISLKIDGADYLKYVNDGRKKGAKQPPIKSIIQWIKAKGLPIAKTKKGVLKTESTAFAIARAIKRDGIKATGVVDKAVASTNKKFNTGLANVLNQAITIDLLNSTVPTKGVTITKK